MDILTQGVAGALFAQFNAEKKEKRIATAVGFCAGLLPDADILIRSANDPLVNLEFHRQFSHSLMFIPFGGLIAAILLWMFVYKHLTFAHTWLYGLFGYSTAGILDACTSFGTQLLWPFLDTRIAWNIISVVDPLFTLMLSLTVLLAWIKRSHLLSTMGIVFAVLYLLLGWLQHGYAQSLVTSLAQSRGHEIQRQVTKPTLGNIILWRSVYYANGFYYVDAVRTGLFGDDQVIPGGRIPALTVNKDSTGLPADSIQSRDVKRFAQLSNDYLVIHPDEPDVIGDIRYAMLPDSIRPLWGIRLDREHPDRHVKEFIRRENDETVWRRFIKMLSGQPVN